MTREQAIEHARAIADEQGWPWAEPVSARRRRPFFFGQPRWEIRTGIQQRGRTIHIEFDADSGAILRKSFSQR